MPVTSFERLQAHLISVGPLLRATAADLLIAWGASTIVMVLLFLIPWQMEVTWHFPMPAPADGRFEAFMTSRGRNVTRPTPSSIRAVLGPGVDAGVPWEELGYPKPSRVELRRPLHEFFLRGVLALQIGLAVVAILRWRSGAGPRPKWSPWRPALFWGACAGILGIAASVALTWLLSLSSDSDPWSALSTPRSWSGALLLMAVTIAPVCEEMFFRGTMLERFARSGRVALGVYLSSALFSAIHGVFALAIVYFVIGVLLAIAYLRGGLFASLLGHMIVNGAGVVSRVF